MSEQFKVDIHKSHQEEKLSDYEYYQLVCFNNLVVSLSAVAQKLTGIGYALKAFSQKSSK